MTQQFRERQQRSAKGKEKETEEETRVGLVDTKLNAVDVVKKCGRLLKLRKGPEGTEHIECVFSDFLRSRIKTDPLLPDSCYLS